MPARRPSADDYLQQYSCAVMQALIAAREGLLEGSPGSHFRPWDDHPAMSPFLTFHDHVRLFWSMTDPEREEEEILLRRVLALNTAVEMRRKCAGRDFEATLEHIMKFDGRFVEDVERTMAASLAAFCRGLECVPERTSRRWRHQSSRNSQQHAGKGSAEARRSRHRAGSRQSSQNVQRS